MTSNNSWFILTLYTPPPPDFTENSVYKEEINNLSIEVNPTVSNFLMDNITDNFICENEMNTEISHGFTDKLIYTHENNKQIAQVKIETNIMVKLDTDILKYVYVETVEVIRIEL